MSKCVSREGEYSDHTPDFQLTCQRCFAFDEDRALQIIGAVRELVMTTDGEYLAADDFDGLAGEIQRVLGEGGVLIPLRESDDSPQPTERGK